MSSCTIKRGIFSLRECGSPVSDFCSVCGTGLCREHACYSMGKVYCASCQNDPQDTSQSLTDANTGNQPEYQRPGWSQHWRDDYHRNSHYTPFLYGWNRDYYTDSDRNGFAAGGSGDAMNENDQAAGFSDS